MAKQKKIKVKLIGKYTGHNAKPNSSFTTGFQFGYDQLAESVQCLQLLNENVEVFAKVADNPPVPLGMFMINEYKVSHDGEATIKLNSTLDYVEEKNFANLAKEMVTILFKATIEAEVENEE